MANEYHQSELHKYCRVCAKKIKDHKHKCSSSGSLLEPLILMWPATILKFTPFTIAIIVMALPRGLKVGKLGLRAYCKGTYGQVTQRSIVKSAMLNADDQSDHSRFGWNL